MNIFYKKSVKRANCLLQGLLAGLLVLCVLTIREVTGGDWSFSWMNTSFEDTEEFFETIEHLIHTKIDAQKDRELFEQDGDFNENREIDIRQYTEGISDGTGENQNPNLTYRLGDLLLFAGDGADRLSSRILSLLDEGYAEDEIGSILLQESEGLETILPVSGRTLSEFARTGTNPPLTVLEYYRSLCETSRDIGKRYQDYAHRQEDDETSTLAPSNVAYFIEDTAGGRYYSNLGATSMLTADKLLKEQSGLTCLLEGERRYNILMTDPEHVYSQAAFDYFLKTRFVGSSENLLIAVDMNYPVGDELQQAYSSFLHRAPVVFRCVLTGGICLVLLIVLLVITVITTGRNNPTGEVEASLFDRLPTEIAIGISLVIAVTWWSLSHYLLHIRERGLWADIFGEAVLFGVLYEILLLAALSILRRVKAGTAWKSSVIYYVFLGTRHVYQAKKSSQRVAFLYIGFVVINIAAFLVGDLPGLIIALVLNLAALLYLMRDVVGNQHIREGLREISQGKLDYRINVGVLTGESREMGEAVNEMGDGLSKAVDSMLRSERMRSELITNVSHDLKTPLTSIINYVDLLKRRKLPDETAREYLDILDQKTQRLKQLTEDLIEVSKISSGNIELHPERLLLGALLMQAVGEFEDSLEAKGLQTKMNLEKEPLWILADGARLWRVFENLLGNICKYAKEGTNVDILLAKEGGNAKVCFHNISDTPITENGDSLKERFVRGDESRHVEGFGLGLSIADSLTALMGGTFEILAQGESFEARLSFPLDGESGEAADIRTYETL